MKTASILALLVLVTGVTVGGATNMALAQEDPTILLKLSKRAQEEISLQVLPDSSDDIKRMFDAGVSHVELLEKALETDDVVSAKEHFLSAMKIFKEISERLTASDSASQSGSAPNDSDVKNPTSDLKRLFEHAEDLKTIVKKHDASIDFSQLDGLFSKAWQQVDNRLYAEAFETINSIKERVTEINEELHEIASQQDLQRAMAYAQKYLEQLDRLIENAKNRGISDEIIEKLETAKENLSSLSNPAEIIKEVKKIMMIKDQFELTENDDLESRIMETEKAISRLSQDGVEQANIDIANDALKTIKHHLAQGEFDAADELLQNLSVLLQEIRNSSG